MVTEKVEKKCEGPEIDQKGALIARQWAKINEAFKCLLVRDLADRKAKCGPF